MTKLYASWVHGSSLNVETPNSVSALTHIGWGADITLKPNSGSWFHIAVPTPVIVADVRSTIQKFFVMFSAGQGGKFVHVHLYDGPNKIQEFDNLNYTGEHRYSLDSQNTFNLSSAHSVLWGIGISFYLQAGSQGARLSIASGGGDFQA